METPPLVACRCSCWRQKKLARRSIPHRCQQAAFAAAAAAAPPRAAPPPPGAEPRAAAHSLNGTAGDTAAVRRAVADDAS